MESAKKPRRWSTFGKFKVDSNKTHKISATGDATRKQRENRTKQRITDSYKARNQELKIEENKRAQRKTANWKRRQMKKIEREIPLYFPSLFSFFRSRVVLRALVLSYMLSY